MTTEMIDTTPDDELIQLVINDFHNQFAKDFIDRYEIVSKSSKYKQAVYVIYVLEGEVYNGGINQFYDNSSIEFAHMLPDALALVGAQKLSDLMRHLNTLHSKYYAKAYIYESGPLKDLEKFYDENPVNDFSKAILDLFDDEKIWQLTIDVIRTHKSEFC